MSFVPIMNKLILKYLILRDAYVAVKCRRVHGMVYTWASFHMFLFFPQAFMLILKKILHLQYKIWWIPDHNEYS